MAGQIGVLWSGKPGSKAVLTGTIDLLGEPIRICIFKNDKKEKDSHPDYRIVRFLESDKKYQPVKHDDFQEPPVGFDQGADFQLNELPF
jgi:hypothetical protein